MIKNDFIKITNLIKKELLENKVLKEAAIEEEKEGNLIDITSIIKQINYTQNKIIEKEPEITSTALIYSGEPLVLTHFVLETIYNNSNPPRIDQITNIRSYNHATSRLMLIYGMVFIFEGLMIHGKLICFFLVILTVMPGIVIVIAIYESVILKKYLKRR